jgi:hypothetical protein
LKVSLAEADDMPAQCDRQRGYAPSSSRLSSLIFKLLELQGFLRQHPIQCRRSIHISGRWWRLIQGSNVLAQVVSFKLIMHSFTTIDEGTAVKPDPKAFPLGLSETPLSGPSLLVNQI